MKLLQETFDFWHTPYLHFIFAIFQFEISSLMNLIFSTFQTFTDYCRQKNAVQTEKKCSSSKWIFKTGELQKSSADR
jgi:hypothetical protein